jgi:hypothetical protein
MRICLNDPIPVNSERISMYFNEMALGGRGFDIIDDTVIHTRDYYSLVSLSDNTAISACTFYPSYSGNANFKLSAVHIPVGITVGGDFRTVQLSAGSMIGYFMKY